MDEFRSVHSADLESEALRQLLAEHVEHEQAVELRRFFMTRLALIAFAVWLLSWPIHLLPHTVLWALLAIAALMIGLTSTSPILPATRNKTRKPLR